MGILDNNWEFFDKKWVLVSIACCVASIAEFLLERGSFWQELGIFANNWVILAKIG